MKGFTLVEMAVVLVIVGLMLGVILMPLAAQMDQKRLVETRATMENAREALLGYAMANGRLPCPAAAPGAGVTAVEAFATAPTAGNSTNGICAGFFNGYLPGVTLGLTPANSSGYILDGWNNPVRYAVSSLSDDANATYIFTKSTGMKTANTACTPPCNTGMSYIAAQNLLYVCSSGSGIAATNCGTATQLTNGAVFVVYSIGKNAATGGNGTDEAANPNPNSANNDRVFVNHETTSSGAANGEFDDVMDWVSSNTVFGRLVPAGQLP
jgi:prepilin-type N-terminal cleavage/methylation domain-containing protein